MINEKEKVLTVEEVVARFDSLAQQEKWFEIQDELFSDDVRSVEPPDSPYFKDAAGKAVVRKKADEWVKKIEEVHQLHTTRPVVAGKHFSVGRTMDFTVRGFGRIKIEELMVYEVSEGKIVLEQFFY